MDHHKLRTMLPDTYRALSETSGYVSYAGGGLGVYLVDQRERVRLTDDGNTLTHAVMNGVATDGLRLRVSEIVDKHGVELTGDGEMVVLCQPDALMNSLLRFFAAQEEVAGVISSCT